MNLHQPGAEPTVVFTFPRWEVSGVTTVNLDLAKALHERGMQCRIVVEENNQDANPYELPAGIPRHSLTGSFPWWRLSPSRSLAFRLRTRVAQRRFRRLLAAERRPVWIPGYAYRLASPSALRSANLGILGVVHADDQTNLGFAIDHGRTWSRCICVSERLVGPVRAAAPWLEPIVRVIPNGVPCAPNAPIKIRSMEGGLRFVYAGRFEQAQKRIHDLAALIQRVMDHGLPIHWDIAGEGPEEASFRHALEPSFRAGVVTWHGALKRRQVRDLFQRADGMILLSNFEGLPMSLLEAMAEGCVPVLSEGCDAGADLVRAIDSGLVFPTGDLGLATGILASLAKNPERLAHFSAKSWGAIANGPHNAAAMGAHYQSVLTEWAEPSSPGAPSPSFRR